MNEWFGKNRDVMAAFDCLSPESLLNRSPFQNKVSLEKIFKEYGPDGSGDVKREVFHEYALFQERFKENDGIKIAMRKSLHQEKEEKNLQVGSASRKVYKPKASLSFCTLQSCTKCTQVSTSCTKSS